MMNEEQAIMDYEAHNAATALALNKAEQEIERLQARIEKLEAVVEAYEQCRVIIVKERQRLGEALAALEE